MNHHTEVVIERRASRIRAITALIEQIATDTHLLKELCRASTKFEALRIQAHIDYQDAQLIEAVISDREERDASEPEPEYIGSIELAPRFISVPSVPSVVSPRHSLDLP